MWSTKNIKFALSFMRNVATTKTKRRNSSFWIDVRVFNCLLMQFHTNSIRCYRHPCMGGLPTWILIVNINTEKLYNKARKTERRKKKIRQKISLLIITNNNKIIIIIMISYTYIYIVVYIYKSISQLPLTGFHIAWIANIAEYQMHAYTIRV